MKKNILKAFAGDMMYSIIALVALNGTIQLLVNPLLTKQMGAAAFGVILSIESVVSIMASSFGSGANYSRLVMSARKEEPKGDYNLFLAIIAAISLIVTLVMLIVFRALNPVMYVSSAVLMIASVLRYYGDVQYKLSINYKGFMKYYIVIAIGYAAGTLLYPVTHSWGIAIALGEVLATVYVCLTGNLYKRPLFEASEYRAGVMRSVWQLSLAYLISSMIMNADRILIMLFVGSAEVTIFYTATLVGKIVAMITSPLNGVLMGHLSKYEGGLTKKMMSAISGALFAVGLLVLVASVIASNIFVMIMYPDVYGQAKPLFLLANAGQIFYFISESLMVIVLRFTGEKLQIILNAGYAVIFFAAAIPAVLFGGLHGLAAAIFAVNIVRYLAVTLAGMFCRQQSQNNAEAQ